MITVLRVSVTRDDNMEACLLRIKSLDQTIIFDDVEIETTGVGAAFYDRLIEADLRAPVRPYMRTGKG